MEFLSKIIDVDNSNEKDYFTFHSNWNFFVSFLQ
jgi:hypothetical protein